MDEIIAQISSFFNRSQIISKFFWVTLSLLLFVFSFFLGRVSKFLESKPSFTFGSKQEEDSSYEQEKNSLFGKVSKGEIVASKNGKKYYFVWCSGASNIKESNKRYFNSEVLAQKAGYILANNCK